MTTTSKATHTVQTLSLANGGVVHEFVSSGGVVFAVSWRGPGRPDLRQLLGDHFETLQTDTVLHAGRRLKRPLAVERPDFIVHSGGHPGAFWGVAFLPHVAPPGLTLREIQQP